MTRDPKPKPNPNKTEQNSTEQNPSSKADVIPVLPPRIHRLAECNGDLGTPPTRKMMMMLVADAGGGSSPFFYYYYYFIFLLFFVPLTPFAFLCPQCVHTSCSPS